MMIEKCISAYHHRLCVYYSINAAKNQYGALYLHEVQHRFCQRQNIIDAEHHIVGAATSFCVRKRNDVFALQKMMLTASGQTMLCPCGHKPKKQEQVFRLALVFWRHHPDLNRGVKVLQTSALPLGYGALFNLYAF